MKYLNLWNLWSIFFVLLGTKTLSLITRHFIEELVPAENGLQLVFLVSIVLLASLLHIACNEHRLQRAKTIARERKMLKILLCEP